MKNKICLNCSQRKNCRNSFVSWIFFIIGIIAALAIRVVTVLMNIRPIYGKISWYVGVSGFLLFFIYKFNINRALSRVIEKENLIEKTREQKVLSAEEYNLIAEILCNLKSEKERINYLFIFVVSALALLLAVFSDFIKQ